MSATSAAQTAPMWVLPLTYELEAESQTVPAEAANARDDDVLLWQLDEDGWD